MNLEQLLIDQNPELSDQPNPEPKRGAAGEVATGLVRGGGVALPAMVGQGMKYFSEPGSPVFEAGESLRTNAEIRGENPELKLQPEAHGVITNSLASGAEMLPASVGPQLVATLGDVLFPPGAPFFHGAAAAGTGVLFGASQAQDTYERVLEATGDKTKARLAGMSSGAVEAGGEALASAIGGKYITGALRFLGPKKGVRVAEQVLERARNPKALLNFGKATALNAASEVGTEMGQNAGVVAVERSFGVTDGPTPGEAAVEAISPTLGMSALMLPLGGVGSYRAHRETKGMLNTLEDASAPADERSRAAAFFYDQIAQKDQKDADLWAAETLAAIGEGKPIAVVESAAPQGEKKSSEQPENKTGAAPAPAMADPSKIFDGLWLSQQKPEPSSFSQGMAPAPSKPTGALSKAVAKSPSVPPVQSEIEQVAEVSVEEPLEMAPQRPALPSLTKAEKDIFGSPEESLLPDTDILPAESEADRGTADPMAETEERASEGDLPKTQPNTVTREQKDSELFEALQRGGLTEGENVTDEGMDLVLRLGKEVGVTWPESGKAQEYDPLIDAVREHTDRARLESVQPNATPLDAQAHEAASSPSNDTPEPSADQIEAGNYKKGHVRLHGMDISIENPAGSVRKGTDETGRSWETKLSQHYGYIRGTIGPDKDHIDVFIKPGVDETTAGDRVYVVDQKNLKTGKFDEPKVMVGYGSEEEARKAYLSNYDKTGPERIRAMTETSVEDFRRWLKEGDTKKPFGRVEKVTYPALKRKAKADGLTLSAKQKDGSFIVSRGDQEQFRGKSLGEIEGYLKDYTPEKSSEKELTTAKVEKSPDSSSKETPGLSVGDDFEHQGIRYRIEDIDGQGVHAVDRETGTIDTWGRIEDFERETGRKVTGARKTGSKMEPANAKDSVDAGKKTGTAPEHEYEEGVDDRELGQIVDEFNDAQASMVDNGEKITHVFDPPEKGEIVRLNDKVKVHTREHGWMSLDEAKARISEWKKHTREQGKKPLTNGNADKVVLSLFDLSGEWSRPWEEAGYQVFRFDIQEDPKVGDVHNFSVEHFNDWFSSFEGQDIYAILAACPCTDFAVSGARHFAAKDADGRTVKSVKLVHQTLATIEYFKPSVWAIENPVGRIEKLGGLPPWRLSFDPNHLGDPYTKKTLLWGRFNADLPVAPVEATEGSKMWKMYGGKSQSTKNARSVTPEGFSYAFFMANNAVDHPVMAVANKFDRLDRNVIEKAIKAGISPRRIDEIVEDFYYQDLDDKGAERALLEAAEKDSEAVVEDTIGGEKKDLPRDVESDIVLNEKAKPAKQKEETDGERAGTGDEGPKALGDISAGEDAATEGGRSVRDRKPGRGKVGAGRNRNADEKRVSGARGGRSGAADVHPAETGGVTPSEAPANIPASNFVITDEVALGKGGESVKFGDNLAAIQTLKALERDNRRATPEEQRTLARYVGWGGLSNAFADEAGNFKAGWEERGKQLTELLTEAELKAARRSTRNAHYTSEPIVRAMWQAVQAMGFSQGMVLEPSAGTGNFLGLAPSEVDGRFVAVEYDSLTARIAGALYPQATVLHSGFQKLAFPDNAFDLAIGNPPFGSESLNFQYRPHLKGYSIHNQFFLSSLESVKPEGLQAMVVSRYLMDAKDSGARLELAKQAKLLGAVRLPDTAFRENARTEVVTDIVFLQKLTEAERQEMKAIVDAYRGRPEKDAQKERERQELAERLPEWVKTTEIADPLGGEAMTVNRYFAAHPEMIVGRLERSGSMRHGADITVRLEKGVDFETELKQRIEALPKNVTKAPATLEEMEKRHRDLSDALRISLEGMEHGSIVMEKDGRLFEVIERETPEGGHEFAKRELSPTAPWSDRLMLGADGKWYTLDDRIDEQGNKAKVKDAQGNPTRRNAKVRNVYQSEGEIPESMRLGGSRFERLKALVEIRDLLKRQLVLETSDAPKAEMETNRRKLAKAYDAFADKHGFLNDAKNEKLIREMPDGALIVALELGYRPALTAAKAKAQGETPRPAEATKAPILSERVVIPYEPPTKASSPADALVISMAEAGRVDLDRLAALLETDHAGVVKALHEDLDEPLIYHDPELNAWQTRDQYLSGQVKRKLSAAREANLEKNIRALEVVQPEPWTADQVTAVIGASWIPADVYESFIEHLTGERGRVSFSRATNSFSAVVPRTAKAKEWETEDANLAYILNQTLNSLPIRLSYTDSDGKNHFMPAETALAQMKASQIGMEFGEWIFAEGDRRRRLVELFNEKFNVRVQRQYEGQHLFLPGKVPDQIIRMRRHQKNAIWRGIQERFLLLDHVVGAGKTFTAISRAMERRRMGLSRKPMIVVPNHMVEQFAADVYKLYPGAKMLAAGKKDFEAKKRRRLFAKIATGDWDIVVVPHSSFKFISISPEAEERYLQEEIRIAQEAIEEAWEEARDQGLDNGWRKPFNVKQAEALAEKLESRLSQIKAKKVDRLLTFEQLGVDDLTVDEAHEFKNLFYSSRMTGVRGMGDRAGSEKAYDLYQKVRVLRDSPTGSVTFMTGTPISNSAVEMYTMMRYLAGEELRELGLEHFDAWRAQFVDASTAWEPTESGRLKEVNRLGRSWSNMRSLMDLYYSFTDAVTLEDIKQWYAEDNRGREFPVPAVKGGDRAKVVVKPTESQERQLQEILSGFDGLEGIQDPNERNAERLRLMDRARKVSLDARAVDPRLPTKEEGGKLEKVSQEVKRLYERWSKDKGTQLVFLDRSVPKSKGDDKTLKEYDKIVSDRDAALSRGDERAYMEAVEALEKYDENEIAELRRAQAGGWNAYQQIKDNLVALGIPEKEIRFVQEANTDEQKQALFDAVNAGEVRVLLGSTPRMGAGTNVQQRLVALHHVDVTWKPSDIEQREGRIIRQGNKLLEKYGAEKMEVEILAYATERTVDAKMWDLNAQKLRTINGIRKYGGEFTMEFEDEEAVGMAEIAALASGDPLLLERVKLDSEIGRLEMLRRGWNRQIMALRDRVDDAEKDIRNLPPRIERRKAEAKRLANALAEAEAEAGGRTITVEGVTYSKRFEAHKAIEEAVKAQQDGNEKDRYAVEVNGEKLTSKTALEKALEEGLGDAVPIRITMDGTEYIHRKGATRALAEKANELAGKLTEDTDTKTARVGSWLGLGLDLDVERRWGGVLATLSLVDEKGSSIESISGGTLDAKEGLFKFSSQYLSSLWQNFERAVRDSASESAYGYMERQLETAQKNLPELKRQMENKGDFPQQEELEQKRDRLEEVVRTLSVKDTGGAEKVQEEGGSEEGESPKFARGSGDSVRPLSDVEFDAVLERVTSRLVNRGGIVVAPTARELPSAILAEIEKQGTRPEEIDGVFHSGKVYIVREHITSAEMLEEIAFHEWHGHAGLYAMMGNDGRRLKREMVELYNAMKPGELLKLAKKYDFSLTRYAKALREAGYDDATRHAILMEEMLAHLTREYSQGKIASKIREIVGLIRDWLRRNGFVKLAQMGETDIALLLKKARAYAEEGAWVKEGDPVLFNGQEILQRLRKAGISDEMLMQALSGTSRFSADGERDQIRFSIAETVQEKTEAEKTFLAKLTPDKDGLIYAALSGTVLPERMKAAIGSVLSNPHYGSRKSKSRAAAYGLSLERGANANEIKYEIMAKKGEYEGLEGVRDYYRKASAEERKMLDKLLMEGDIRGKEYTEEELSSVRNPLGHAAPENVQKAYFAFRTTLNRSTEVMFDRLGRLRLLPYEETPYHQELIDLLDENLSIDEVERRFGIERKAVDAYLQIRQGRAKLDQVTQPYRNQPWYSTLRDALVKGLSAVQMQQEFGKTPDLVQAFQDIKRQGEVKIATAEQFKKAQWYKTLADLLTVGDDHPMLQKLELYNAYRGVKEYDGRLAKLKEEWRQAKGYLPRIRKDGEQHVKVWRVEEDGTYTEVWMQPAKTVFGANRLRKKVEKNLENYIPHSFDPQGHYEVVVEPNTATPEEIFMGIGSHRAIEGLLSKVFDKATDAGILENSLEVQQKVLSILADEISARGFGRHRLSRAEHLIEGYETENTPAILSQFVGGMAGWLSKSEFAMRANKLMSQIPADRPMDKSWIREYVDDALKNSNYIDQWFGTARSFAALMFLGFKASSAFLNATQNYIWGQALLSKHTKGATRKLLKAQHDVVKDHLLVKAGKPGILSAEERWVLEEGLRRGRSHANYVRAMAGMDDNGGVLGKGQAGIRWLTEKAMIPFQAVETYWNREPALIAAYRVFREKGMDQHQALKEAEKFVDDVHFVVGKENIPALLRKMGPLGRTLYTFQSYTHNYLLGMLTSLSQREFNVVMRSVTALVLFGGLAALPFGDDLDKWYRRIYGERPLRMLDKWLRETAGQYTDFGDQIADFVLHGAPALAGVNFSRSIGVSIPWFSPEDDSLAERVTGVWAGLIQKGIYAGSAASKGDFWRSAEFISPEALANILRAYRLYADGATTLSGRPVFGDDGKQSHYTAGEGIIRAFGFMPLRPAKETEARWDAIRGQTYWRERKSDVLARFRTAKNKKEAMKEIRRFNRELREVPTGVLVPPITLKTLRQALHTSPDRREQHYRNQL